MDTYKAVKDNEAVQVSTDGSVSLLERSYGGLNVEVRWVEGTEYLLLCVARGENRYATIIDGENAKDAFEHPYPYLAAKGVDFES